MNISVCENQGFSLVELIVALSLIATVLTLGIPAMRDMISKNRLETTLHGFHAHISTTRNTAIMHGRRITMTPLGGSWSDGWQVFEDANNNAQVDDGERVLAYAEAPREIHISSVGSTAHYISFNASGQAVQLNGAFQAGTFLFCTAKGERQALVLSRAGRVRAEKNPTRACP